MARSPEKQPPEDSSPENLVVIGKIGAVYGVAGWLKVYSHTEPMSNFLDYRHCYVKRGEQWQQAEIKEGRRHGKGLVARFAGVDDRELARSYTGCEVAVPASALPELEAEEYYWHQLEGLQVLATAADGSEVLLGRVDHLIATGANDVLVVRKCAGSLDRRERMIPYVPDQYVLEINLAEGWMRVDWDPDF